MVVVALQEEIPVSWVKALNRCNKISQEWAETFLEPWTESLAVALDVALEETME